jgi:hypothetical protein
VSSLSFADPSTLLGAALVKRIALEGLLGKVKYDCALSFAPDRASRCPVSKMVVFLSVGDFSGPPSVSSAGSPKS